MSDTKERIQTLVDYGRTLEGYEKGDRAHATGIASIQNFAAHLRRDILAVEAAVTTRWSNGPVEGQLNPLKMLKRQMYGRAGVELLRARLIPLSVDLASVQRK